VSADIAIVFDLDGTLVDSHAFDSQLYAEALREVLGDVDIDPTWRRYRHVTDEGILAQILAEAGLAAQQQIRLRMRELFGAKVEHYLARGGRCESMPGAIAAIEALRAAGCRLGIATGGWEHTARMKLARAGFSLEGLALASSDDAYDRVDIMNACLRRIGGTPDRAVYVGDGHWDLEASGRAGWRFIGIGDKLHGLHEPWVADFTDPAWRQAVTQAYRDLA